ncbi:MAG TPA: alpha/beta hydrolase [Anaeromyxobacteraceae bacterium]|nr:alpha/beta hydrolase [Anaeromyxobacteraceae bacterium]
MDRMEHHAAGTDGTRLWWSEAGAGAPAVLLLDGIGCAGYVWRRLEPALAERTRVLHAQYRGHGASAAPKDPARVGMDDLVSDVLAVLDAAGERRAVLVGHSMGVQVALETHRRAPRRVAGLALLCGAPGHPIDTFHDSPVLRLAFPWARAVAESRPELARAFFRNVVPTELALELALAFEVNRALAPREDLERYLRDLSNVDPLLFLRMLTSAADQDASDHLPNVRVPTLVVAGERDTFTPMRLSVAMHAAIPGSRLVVVKDGTHVAPLERPDVVDAAVTALVAEVAAKGARRAKPPRPRAAPRRRLRREG